MHNTYLILKEIDKETICRQKEIDKNNPVDYCKHILYYTHKKPDIENKVTEHVLKYFPFLLYYENIRTGDSMYKLIEYLNILTALKKELSYYQYPVSQKDMKTIQDLFRYSCKIAKKKSIVLSENDFSHLDNYILRENDQLTDKGIYFLLCLFLEKKHAHHLLSNIKELRHSQEDSYKANIDSFTAFCCKLPSYNTGDSNIALDILNELNRCPKELFKLLGDKEKKEFCLNTSIHTGHEGISQTVIKRYCDRFPHFALRYFDHSKALDGITFHLQLGFRHTEEAHKKSINSVIRTHNILKPIRTFNDLAYYRTENAATFFSQDETIEDYTPKYRIAGNRIGLLLDMPQTQKYEIKRNNIPPHAILSTHELGALFFYNHLYKKGLIKVSPKELISNYIENFKRFIVDLQAGVIQPILSERPVRTITVRGDKSKPEIPKDKLQEKLNKYNLKIGYLPDACKEYLSSYRTNSKEQQIRDKLKKVIYKCKRQINTGIQINEKSADIYNRKSAIDKLVRELAHDIVLLTPPHEINRKGIPHLQKIGNMEFEVLERMLAHFPTSRQELRNHFDLLSVRDRGRKRWLHPFLFKFITYDLDQCNGLTDLYIRYFQRKERWLLNMIRFNLSDKKWTLLRSAWEISGQYNYFLKLNKIKPAVKKDYLKETIILPTGLFDAEIAKAMKSAGYSVKEEDNAAYSVKAYFKGLSQNYYSLPRYYDGSIISENWDMVEKDILKDRIKALWKNVDEASQKKLKSLTKHIKENETLLLTRQYNDRILFLMANDLLPASNKLKNEDIADINNTLNDVCTIREVIYGRTVVVKLPIKSYGEFRHFMKERRLKNLFKYISPEKEIFLDEIKCKEDLYKNILYQELNTYDLKKKELWEQMYLFEKTICTKFYDKIETAGKYITHDDCIRFAQKELDISHANTYSPETFMNMRENILCNELPYEEWLKEKIVNENDNSSSLLTEKILSVLSDTYQKMNQMLISEMN